LQRKKKSRRLGVLTRKPRSELLNDDHLRDYTTVRTLSYVPGGKVSWIG
jgi:hypothetical protein